MRQKTALLATIALFSLVRQSLGALNVTGAIATFMISSCEQCTNDKSTAFCTESAGGDTTSFVQNATMKVTIAQKKQQLGNADGSTFCWAGTFGKLLDNEGTFDTLLGSANVTVSLQCGMRQLYFNQCILSAELAIILMCVGGVVLIGGTTIMCFCCGCCKCCNEKGDESKWGCCNRFCPWCTLCADKHMRDTDDDKECEMPEERSLTGRSSRLNDAYGKPAPSDAAANSSGEQKEPDNVMNPLRATAI